MVKNGASYQNQNKDTLDKKNLVASNGQSITDKQSNTSHSYQKQENTKNGLSQNSKNPPTNPAEIFPYWNKTKILRSKGVLRFKRYLNMFPPKKIPHNRHLRQIFPCLENGFSPETSPTSNATWIRKNGSKNPDTYRLVKKITILKGNTSTHSGSIFQPVMLVYPGV